ncbi:Imm21 family immunity protein [Kitasatospora purpeofusca]|uniref:Imm21 family immunity protein n=1 Tax=Kitasatospora purpeofusca TaxID=67352 RepID=UPI0036D13BFA
MECLRSIGENYGGGVGRFLPGGCGLPGRPTERRCSGARTRRSVPLRGSRSRPGWCPGPVVLFDAAWTGGESRLQQHLRVDPETGAYGVRAAHVEPDPRTALTPVAVRRLPG